MVMKKLTYIKYVQNSKNQYLIAKTVTTVTTGAEQV